MSTAFGWLVNYLCVTTIQSLGGAIFGWIRDRFLPKSCAIKRCPLNVWKYWNIYR